MFDDLKTNDHGKVPKPLSKILISGSLMQIQPGVVLTDLLYSFG
jgi:hypothetical protein